MGISYLITKIDYNTKQTSNKLQNHAQLIIFNTMNYKTMDIALEIINDLSITDLGPGFVDSWVKNNIGQFNVLIQGSYTVDDATFEVSPVIGPNESAVIKKMFEVYNFDRLIRANIGSSGFSSVLEVSEGENKIKMVNKTELAKVYSELKKQCALELRGMVDKYKQHSISPVSVDGAETSIDYPTFYPYPGYNPRRGYR